MVEAARSYLAKLPLERFGTSRHAQFRAELDRATRGLKRKLPPAGRSWGMARKLVNIFLRDALYTVYLRDAFHLERTERFLEMPLDSITARRLRREVGRARLPRWRRVKVLTPNESRAFQDAAQIVSARRGIARVHLDAIWWSHRE
jgi:hypothetical protein